MSSGSGSSSESHPNPGKSQGKSTAIAMLALCELGAMALWFSATAVVPSLTAQFALSGAQASLLTTSVQAGFVAGTLISAIFGLSDRLDPRRFFMTTALVAAVANGTILLIHPASVAVVGLRFVTGMCMAGIYPVGMKMAATWAKGDLGLLVGLLVGALTVGSASPHLFNALGGIDWRVTIGGASIVAAISAVAINAVRLGPNVAPKRAFRAGDALIAWRSVPLRLANGGYLGHMWELYAMWAWLGVFLDASFRIASDGPETAFWARVATFSAIGIGGLAGAVAGGMVADRVGRTALTMAALAVSGACAVSVGLLFGASPWILFAVCLLWGAAVIADSAQFSAAIAELSPPDLVGTMLTVQTSIGFLLTLVTIQLMPVFVEAVGWRWAFSALAIGPILGIWSMARLRGQSDAVRIAGGRR